MLARREALGGFLPQRRTKSSKSFIVPGLDKYERLLTSSGERTYSTTMAFVQSLNITLRDKALGPHIVPIVADEARTFGMEGLFRQIGIYAPFGQKYKPVDADQLMYYREDESGQVLQQGITEPGAIASWMAAGTSYSVSDVPMLPFYIYYSMFGFQRIGDIAWQAADMRTRGFLLGGTAGRTTLNGEGLQHEDGHSHLMAGAIPNVRSYDPTFGYEVTVILQHGMKAMMQDQIDEYYYLTLMNENYAHPDMPAGVEQGIIKGMYLLKDAGKPKKANCACNYWVQAPSCAKPLLLPNYSIKISVSLPISGPAPALANYAKMALMQNDGTASIQTTNRVHPTSPNNWKTVRDRPLPQQITYVCSPTKSVLSYRCTTPSLAPMASGAAIPAATCAASSKWTATLSPTLRLPH